MDLQLLTRMGAGTPFLKDKQTKNKNWRKWPMKFLPRHVQDVNVAPQNTGDKSVLAALLTFDNGAGLWDSARIAAEISKRHDVSAAKRRKIGLLGGKGYIGRHLSLILRGLGFAVYHLDPSDINPHCSYIINLACPRKTIKTPEQISYLEADYPEFLKRFREGYVTGQSFREEFNIPSHRCLYFSSQSIFDSPASSVYSQCKQIATDECMKWGWKIFAPGTVFGSFMDLLRTDTVINKLLNDPNNPGNYITNASRSFISIYEVIEAVVAFLCGEDIEPWQSWSVGRTRLNKIISEDIAPLFLLEDTGTSLKNFYPPMKNERKKLYRRYISKFVSYSQDTLIEVI